MSTSLSDLENALRAAAGELEKVKGFSISSALKVLATVLAFGPGIGMLWEQADDETRKKAVINVANEYIDIPFIGESFEAALLGLAWEIGAFGLDKIDI